MGIFDLKYINNNPASLTFSNKQRPGGKIKQSEDKIHTRKYQDKT